MSYNRDFHGWTLDDAVQEVHNIVGEIRMKNSQANVEFITGHGIIREEIMTVLEAYDIPAQIQWGNSGVIVALID